MSSNPVAVSTKRERNFRGPFSTWFFLSYRSSSGIEWFWRFQVMQFAARFNSSGLRVGPWSKMISERRVWRQQIVVGSCGWKYVFPFLAVNDIQIDGLIQKRRTGEPYWCVQFGDSATTRDNIGWVALSGNESPLFRKRLFLDRGYSRLWCP